MTRRYERERFRADLAKVRAEHPHLDIGDPPREMVTLKERRLRIMREGLRARDDTIAFGAEDLLGINTEPATFTDHVFFGIDLPGPLYPWGV